MALTKRSPETSAVDRQWNVMDRMFDEMWRAPFRSLLRAPFLGDMGDTNLFGWHLPADIEENSDRFVVRMDLPGVSKKDIHVSIDNNVLTIHGERKREGSDKDEDYRVQERFYGKFERSFMLPKTVDSDSVQAEFKDGVLTINITKHEQSRTREIEIR